MQRPMTEMAAGSPHDGHMNFPIRSARRAFSVPPGRIGYNIQAPTLLLHTVQTSAAFDELLATGKLVPDASLAEPEFEDAYAWMLRQMEARLPTRGNGALWLWAKIRRGDLLFNCRLSGGDVLLTCRIPRERVLLSQYDAWHEVLNRAPSMRPLPGESDNEYEARFDALLDDVFDRLRAAGASPEDIKAWPLGLRREVEESWQSILDTGNYPKTVYWQATVHELRAEDVTEAVRFEDAARPFHP